jgi:hypothetical protein
MTNGFGLTRNRSSTQSAIIVPKAQKPYIYYIFTVDQTTPENPWYHQERSSSKSWFKLLLT